MYKKPSCGWIANASKTIQKKFPKRKMNKKGKKPKTNEAQVPVVALPDADYVRFLITLFA